MKFLHTADLQLGEKFTRFGYQAENLRRARMQTLERILEVARENEVDAVLIAGDLFEDNQVSDSVRDSAFSILQKKADVPVYILPGNHDHLRPASIWERAPFTDPPSHVCVLRESEAVEINSNTVLLPRPLTQKKDRHDPSRKIGELAQNVGNDIIRIGITHGSPSIGNIDNTDDHPIQPQTAAEANVHYLALGHWHNWKTFNDNTIVMPGTPEPDNFDSQEAGYVALIDIPDSESVPEVTPIRVNTLSWKQISLDITPGNSEPQEENLKKLEEQLSELDTDPENTVLCITLIGTSPGDFQVEENIRNSELLERFTAKIIDDQSVTALSEAQLEEIKERSPIVASVLADLANVKKFYNPETAETIPEDITPMQPHEFERLLVDEIEEVGENKNEPQDVAESVSHRARQLLMSQLREEQDDN